MTKGARNPGGLWAPYLIFVLSYNNSNRCTTTTTTTTRKFA